MNFNQFDKPLPQNIDAERSVLGALLLNSESINLAIHIVQPEDFFREAHAVLFRTMIELDDEGLEFDLVSVSERLAQKKKLGEVGGAPYLASLMEVVSTAANIEHHCQIVAEKSLSRQLLRLGHKVVQEAFEDGEPISAVLDRTEQNIFQLAEKKIKNDVVKIDKIIQDSIERISLLHQRKESITGIPSGFHDLDKLTNGFQNSDMIIIAARPSVGKTSFVLNIAEYVALKQKLPVLIFSLEMSKESIVQRLLCSVARIDSQNLRRGFLTRDDWSQLRAAADLLDKAPIYLDDTPGMNIMEMRAKARREKNSHDIRMIFIDYLQLMKGVGRIESRQQEISQISRSVKEMAKEINLPVLICSQLSREIEKRKEKEPRLSDLRESGSIEQDGDVIGFLHQPEVEAELGADESSKIIELVLAKQRNGPTGNINLVFRGKYTRFETRATRDQETASDVLDEEEMEEMEDEEVPF